MKTKQIVFLIPLLIISALPAFAQRGVPPKEKTSTVSAALRGDQVWVMNAKSHDLEDSTAVPSKRLAIQRAVFKPIPKKLRK